MAVSYLRGGNRQISRQGNYQADSRDDLPLYISYRIKGILWQQIVERSASGRPGARFPVGPQRALVPLGASLFVRSRRDA